MFFYFAYGSNMLTRRLTAPRRAPSAKFIGTGYIEGYRLTFDKASNDGSGKCDAEATGNPEDRVYGVVYSIAEDEAGALDTAEAVGHGYRKGEIDILTPQGPLRAVAYFATQKNARLLPFHWYKSFVVQGAIEHELPEIYIERLQAVQSQEDTFADRR